MVPMEVFWRRLACRLRWPWRILCPCRDPGEDGQNAWSQVSLVHDSNRCRKTREPRKNAAAAEKAWCENTECVVQNPKFAFRNKAKGDYQPRWKVCRLEEKRQRRAKDRAKKKA